jgi:O-antigen biosynthesis protein
MGTMSVSEKRSDEGIEKETREPISEAKAGAEKAPPPAVGGEPAADKSGHMTLGQAKPAAKPEAFGTLLTFDHDTGGLVITSVDADYDLFVDNEFNSVNSLALSELRLDRLNRIIDSALAEDIIYWRIGGTDSITPVGRNLSEQWTLERGNTAYLAAAAGPDEKPVTAVFHCPIEGANISVTPGTVYTFQALFGLHRCRATIRFVFLDDSGAELRIAKAPVDVTNIGGREAEGYARVHLTARAPDKAAAMRVEIIKGATLEGDDSFLFFARPALCRSAQVIGYQYLINDMPEEVTVSCFNGGVATVYSGQIPIPDEALDGGWHKVGVRNRRTGVINTVPIALPASVKSNAMIHGLEGSSLVCQLGMPSSWTHPVGVSLWIDGKPHDEKFYSEPGNSILRIPLPLKVCDGLPHVFSLRLGTSGQLLGQHACIGPNSTTPWEALQKYAGLPLPAQLAPLASYRYASLAAGSTGSAAKGSPSLRELHDILLEGFDRPRKEFRVLPFPAVKSPDVSIVIPVHNKFDVTYVCLAALLFATTRASFEVIVVDDGSHDTTMQLAQIAPGVVVVRNDTALGFVGACNAGAEKARGRYIVFLNNDTEPTAHWLDELLFVFENFEGVGLAGSKLIYPDGSLQESGGIVWETGDPWNYGRRANPHDPRYSYARIADYLSGAAIMIPTPLWKELEGFSREFMPAYFEDTDLAFKVKNAGRKVVFAPHSVVVHYEGMSNGTDQTASSGLKRFQEINRPKFKRKWISLFQNNGKVGVNVDLAKDRGIKKRVLFIDAEVPQIDRDAGSYAAIQEIRLFQALGCKVTFAPLNMAYLGRHTDYLQHLGVETVHAPFYSSVAAFLKERGSEFDLVFITRYGVAEQVVSHVNQHAGQARVVMNVADLHFLRMMRDAVAEKSEAKMNEALRTREAEIAALSRVELVLSYSSVEQSVITSHITLGPKTGIVPWVVDIAPVTVKFKERKDVAFLGGFGHPPNAAAVKYFASEVMPLLRRVVPGVRFMVYGSKVPPEIAALACEDIVIAGYVRDVADVFNSCRVFVAPLLSGAGMKGKVLDCIAAGIPSVLSPIAAEGIGLRDGSDTIIARKPEEWAEAIRRLYLDEAAWTAMSKSVHELAASKFSFAAGVTALSDALASIDFFVVEDAPALHVNSTRPRTPASLALSSGGTFVPALVAKPAK